MFFHIDIKADGLPPRTICLTYDDGPGPGTAELAAFLSDRGIAATFFVIGRHAEGQETLLAKIRGQGHLIGNHTDSHPGLANLAASGGDVVEEVRRTDAILAPHFGAAPRFLRPPYGNWRPVDAEHRDLPISIVARALNRNPQCRGYVGPINWDISGQDYDFWRQGLPAEDCAQRYLDRIRTISRGMVLMHDSSEDPESRRHNRADEVTRIIVPILQSEGFQFVRLDEIPQVRTAMAVSSVVALRGEEGTYLGWTENPPGRIVGGARSIGAREQFGVVAIEPGRVALRATNGFFLADRPGAGGLVVDADSLNDALDVEIEGDRIALPIPGTQRLVRFQILDLFDETADDAGFAPG